MDYKKTIDNINEWEGLEKENVLPLSSEECEEDLLHLHSEECNEEADEIQDEKDAVVKKQDMAVSQATLLTNGDENFSDVKQYPENPFTYFETNQVNVELSSGDFRYEVTDFVLPGRDGFDVSIARRYNSGCANLVDMDVQLKNNKLYTGSKDNSHYSQTYGLGYGWSFVLPSIETVMYYEYYRMPILGYESEYPKKSKIYQLINFDYIFHLEDGRSLNINRSSDKFNDYALKDVTISNKSGSIQHPYTADVVKKYNIIIEYKNGNIDYFEKENGDYNAGKYSSSIKLVARQDKFGNVICFDLKDYGGMTIIDTWGRKISLDKTNDGLTWILPGWEPGKTSELSYQIDQTKPLKLTAVTDLAGCVTQYNYYNPDERKGVMRYLKSKSSIEVKNYEARPYLLLKDVIYPNGALTQFEYNKDIGIENGAGLRIVRYPLSGKKDTFGETEYNCTEYNYEMASTNGYIKSADVKKHQDILETCKFSEEGLLSEKEIRHQDALMSKSIYEYDKKYKTLMTSAIDKVFDRNDENKVLEKKTSWTYSADQKADITQINEEYPDDPTCNQKVDTIYGDYSIILQTKTEKGSDTIRETYELDPELGNRLIKCRRIFENEILKEKTVYDYKDLKNPYCVTSEKQYVLIGNGNLEQAGDLIETVYTYNSGKYTHKFVSSERKGIKDADGKSCDSIRETIDYDNLGRIISKTDPRKQVSTVRYDKLGRIVEETLPSAAGQPITNKTYYNDRLNYITKTDANHQKKRIQYSPFGQVQQVCLAVADEPKSTDIVLQNFRYNSWGELIEVITYDGNGTAASHVRKTERYTYDSFGRVLSRSIPQVGYEDTCHYDEVFLDPVDVKKYYREQKTVRGDSIAPDMVTEVYKDQKGQIRKEFLAGKRIATYEYDNAGNNVRKIDAQNKTERWAYDYAGRVVKSVRTDAGQDRVTRIEFDALGNKRFSWDEAGKKTEFKYDTAGRLIQTIAPFDHRSQIVKYYYDRTGNVIWEKKAQNDGWQEIQYVYDPGSRLIDTYQYLSPTNWIRTRYQYDTMGNVTQMRTGGTPSGEGKQVTKYTYDRFGNVVTMTDARGGGEYCQYDKVGRLQEKTDRNGNQTIYQHDALDRLIKETVSSRTSDGTVISEREYGYSKNGKLMRETSREKEDGKQTAFLETRYYYDNKGQLIRQEDPGNAVKDYTYDIQGNRQSFRLNRKGQAAADVSLYYLYDDLYRLKQVRKNGATGTVLAEYEYDAKGNRKTLRYPQNSIETSYTYNHADRVISLENKRQGATISGWEYGYDVDGNLLTKKDKVSSPAVTISYRYDRLGRLVEEDYSGWKRTLYTYDACSNRTKMMVEGKTKDELVSVTNYEYGLNNWLEKEIRKQGKTTETYHFRYDDNGNETFRIWEKTAPTPDYPGNLKLSGGRQAEVPTVYEWRHYNGFHQLIRINQDDKEITYQYRGDGLRHSSEVRNLTESQSKTNVFYWDDTNIIAEQVDGGHVKKYLRGINLIAGEIDGVIYYYIFNEHGDVAQLLGGNGTCKAFYEYDAFGNEKNPNKEDKNPFRYCGEYFDLNSSTYYLRARDYRSSVGRFTQEDPIEDGLNWYVYTSNNPVMHHDPSGYAAIPSWVKTTAKIALGVVVVGAAVVVSVSTLGLAPAVAMKMVVTGAALGTFAGVVGDVAVQYFNNGWSFNNYNINSSIIAGVQGGVSGAFGMTTIGVRGQVIGNAAIAGIGSALKGDSLGGIAFNTIVGGVAGRAGGSGAGPTGFYQSNARAWKVTTGEYIQALLKSTAVSNGLGIVKTLGMEMWSNTNRMMIRSINNTMEDAFTASKAAMNNINMTLEQSRKTMERVQRQVNEIYRNNKLVF